MKLLATLNPENVTQEEMASFPAREAFRAVVFDEEDNIALLFVSQGNYFKLPGGGKEKGESTDAVLKRECQEEIGCDISVIAQLGKIVEYRKFCTLQQTSYCYVAKTIGSKGLPHFTPEEVADGLTTLWLPYSEATKLIAKNEATNLEGREYIVPRDIIFLEAAKQFVE